MFAQECWKPRRHAILQDRKSTRLNSSHSQISYAVFCLKQKNNIMSHSIGHPRPLKYEKILQTRTRSVHRSSRPKNSLRVSATPSTPSDLDVKLPCVRRV